MNCHINYERSVIPVMNGELCNLSALFNEFIWMIEELIEIVWIFGLTRHCCKSFMPNYRLLLSVLYTLSNQVLMISTSDLAKDKTDLVFEQTGLGLIVLFGEQQAQISNTILCLSVPHQIHYPVFGEKRNVISQQQSEKSFLPKYIVQLILMKIVLQVLLTEWSSRLLCLEILCTICTFYFILSYLLYCYL